MNRSKVVLYIIDVLTRALAVLFLLSTFVDLFQIILFSLYNSLILLYLIFWSTLVFISVQPNFLFKRLNNTEVSKWFIARIPSFTLSIIGVIFFFNKELV